MTLVSSPTPINVNRVMDTETGIYFANRESALGWNQQVVSAPAVIPSAPPTSIYKRRRRRRWWDDAPMSPFYYNPPTPVDSFPGALTHPIWVNPPGMAGLSSGISTTTLLLVGVGAIVLYISMMRK